MSSKNNNESKHKSYIVYCHTNKINGKRYVGITSRGLIKRAGSCGSLYKSSPVFFAAINKHGWDNFQHTVLYKDLTIEQAAELERDIIVKWDLINPDKGYNAHLGGFPTTEELSKYTDKSRVEKIKDTLSKQRSDPEYRKIMSSRMKEVWARPGFADFRKESMLAAGKWGRPHVCVKLVSTGEVFSSRAAFARSIGIPPTTRSLLKLKHVGDTIKMSHKGVVYELVVVLKESELLEAPPSKVEGNQQPIKDSLSPTKDMATGKGSETIPAGSRG
jgi:group I intron endonuclease